MNRIRQTFLEVYEDYLSTKTEASDLSIKRFDLVQGFIKQLAIKVWGIGFARIAVGLTLIVLAPTKSFLETSALFSIITLYVPVPSLYFLRGLLLARVVVLIEIITKVPFQLARKVLFDNLTPISLFAVVIVWVLLAYLNFGLLKTFYGRSTYPKPLKLAVTCSYTFIFYSLLVSRTVSDPFLGEWLNFWTLIFAITNALMLGMFFQNKASRKSA